MSRHETSHENLRTSIIICGDNLASLRYYVATILGLSVRIRRFSRSQTLKQTIITNILCWLHDGIGTVLSTCTLQQNEWFTGLTIQLLNNIAELKCFSRSSFSKIIE
jgi:hypothetical protein